MVDVKVPWNRIVTVEDIDPSLMDSFSCGNEQMDSWFLTKALSWCYLGFCQVYIALGSDGIVGFFSLSPTSVRPVELTRSQRHGKNSMEHPGILLGRIAVREDIQKSSYSAGLPLGRIFRRAASVPDPSFSMRRSAGRFLSANLSGVGSSSLMRRLPNWRNGTPVMDFSPSRTTRAG